MQKKKKIKKTPKRQKETKTKQKLTNQQRKKINKKEGKKGKQNELQEAEEKSWRSLQFTICKRSSERGVGKLHSFLQDDVPNTKTVQMAGV